MPIRVWQVIENGADAQGRVRNRGRYPSAWLANNKALRQRSKGQAFHVEATEVADNQLRDFLGGRLVLLWWRYGCRLSQPMRRNWASLVIEQTTSSEHKSRIASSVGCCISGGTCK